LSPTALKLYVNLLKFTQVVYNMLFSQTFCISSWTHEPMDSLRTKCLRWLIAGEGNVSAQFTENIQEPAAYRMRTHSIQQLDNDNTNYE